jgi:hypothetical protein
VEIFAKEPSEPRSKKGRTRSQGASKIVRFKRKTKPKKRIFIGVQENLKKLSPKEPHTGFCPKTVFRAF